MWFDLVLVDRLLANGILESRHIRTATEKSLPVDRLEDIDQAFREVDATDIGTIRVYGTNQMRTSTIRSKLRNFVVADDHMLVQFEHFKIPVISGYYAVIFPKDWRLSELNIYDPYDKAENVAQKRSFREIDVVWDDHSRLSCAQFNMETVRRGEFSLGVIALLRPAEGTQEGIGRPGTFSVVFSDERHERHTNKEGFEQETAQALQTIRTEPKMPGITIGLAGPSVNIIEWARYIKDLIRKPKIS